MPEHAQLGVGAVVVEQPREELRDHRLPARIRASRPAPARAPSGTRRRSPGSAPAPPASARSATRGERSMFSTYCLISWRRSAPSAVSRNWIAATRLRSIGRRDWRIPSNAPHDVVLPGDDVQRRQVPQPGRHRPRRQQRIGVVLGLRGQESEHGLRQVHSVASGDRYGAGARTAAIPRRPSARHAGPRMPQLVAVFIYSPIRDGGAKTRRLSATIRTRTVACNVMPRPRPSRIPARSRPDCLIQDSPCHSASRAPHGRVPRRRHARALLSSRRLRAVAAPAVAQTPAKPPAEARPTSSTTISKFGAKVT